MTQSSEQCDLGMAMNTGGYGGCNEDCTRGPRCGDSIVQAPDETCDDGFNDNSYGGCSTTCQYGPHCGDGNLDQNNGEQCEPPNTTTCNARCRNRIN
jgi:cysteine-rich repeat protein